jgi:hypothetical protein
MKIWIRTPSWPGANCRKPSGVSSPLLDPKTTMVPPGATRSIACARLAPPTDSVISENVPPAAAIDSTT